MPMSTPVGDKAGKPRMVEMDADGCKICREASKTVVNLDGMFRPPIKRSRDAPFRRTAEIASSILKKDVTVHWSNDLKRHRGPPAGFYPPNRVDAQADVQQEPWSYKLQNDAFRNLPACSTKVLGRTLDVQARKLHFPKQLAFPGPTDLSLLHIVRPRFLEEPWTYKLENRTSLNNWHCSDQRNRLCSSLFDQDSWKNLGRTS